MCFVFYFDWNVRRKKDERKPKEIKIKTQIKSKRKELIKCRETRKVNVWRLSYWFTFTSKFRRIKCNLVFFDIVEAIVFTQLKVFLEKQKKNKNNNKKIAIWFLSVVICRAMTFMYLQMKFSLSLANFFLSCPSNGNRWMAHHFRLFVNVRTYVCLTNDKKRNKSQFGERKKMK